MNEKIVQYNQLLDQLLSFRPLPFSGLPRNELPTLGGIYRVSLIDSNGLATTYIGKTGNLRERLYRNHLMGNLVASNLKKKLVSSGACTDAVSAKVLLTGHYQVQYIQMDDARERTFFEHFAVAVLQPLLND